MALGDVYVDAADLKDRLGIDDDDDAVRMDGAVQAASRGIEKFCGRQFNDAGVVSTRVFQVVNNCLAHVDDFSTVTGLVIKTDDDDDGTFERTWTTSDYELAPLNGVVDGEVGWPFWKIRHVGWSRGFPQLKRAGLQVTARWGWAAVPAAVSEACRIAAEEIFKLRDTPFGIGGYGDFGVIRVRDNPFTSRMLNPYRRNAVLVA
jgi:hypothetical protein